MSAAERKALFSKPSPRDELFTSPPPPSGWGGNGVSEGMEAMNINANGNGNGSEGQQGGSKKKGKQKQILFSVSARPQ
jgi:hypothetical protein